MRLSRADFRLLDALQQDVTRSQSELAELAGTIYQVEYQILQQQLKV